MIGDITQNLVGQFNNNFGKNNQMDYPKGGINYLDNGNNAEPLVGKVTYGEKISKSYTPAKLLSVSNKQGDYSTGGKMFAAASSVITTYLNKANKNSFDGGLIESGTIKEFSPDLFETPALLNEGLDLQKDIFTGESEFNSKGFQ